MMAMEQATIFIVLPDKWIVAHNGMTNVAMFSLTPFFLVCAKVTGIVAADDCVPSAVAYAGSIFFSNPNGFFFPIRPAMRNCIKSKAIWSIKITIITRRNNKIMGNTELLTVIFRKMPNICKGNRGIITLAIRIVIISLKSKQACLSVFPFISDSPRPIQKDNSNAVITGTAAGISMEKNGVNNVSPVPHDELRSVFSGNILGNIKSQLK